MFLSALQRLGHKEDNSNLIHHKTKFMNVVICECKYERETYWESMGNSKVKSNNSCLKIIIA